MAIDNPVGCILEDHVVLFLGACILASNSGDHNDGQGDPEKYVRLAEDYYKWAQVLSRRVSE